MCNFRIGQEVVCLKSNDSERGQPRKKGVTYIVLDVRYCPRTGGQSINITSVPLFDEMNKKQCKCSRCGDMHPSYGKWWTVSDYFAPLQTDSEEADMAEALEEVFSQPLFQ